MINISKQAVSFPKSKSAFSCQKPKILNLSSQKLRLTRKFTTISNKEKLPSSFSFTPRPIINKPSPITIKNANNKNNRINRKFISSSITSNTINNVAENSVKISSESISTVAAAHSPYHFELPPTFGVTHEVFQGGRVPDQMIHIDAIQGFLNFIHSTVGLPWWGTIALTTVLFRTLVLPLNLSLIRNSSRLSTIRKEIENLGQIISNNNVPFDDKVEASEKMRNLFKENKCHPLLNIASPFVMAPMFLSVFLSVERICLHEPTAAKEGLLWFNDLSAIDPTFLLPALSGLTWLITVEMGADQPRTYAMNQFRSLVRFIAGIMVPVTVALPCGVFVYWITSNLFTICQIKTVSNPKIRELLRIPPKPKGDEKAQSV